MTIFMFALKMNELFHLSRGLLWTDVEESYLTFVSNSCSLLEALAHLDGWGVEVERDRRVCVGVVFNSVQTDRI